MAWLWIKDGLAAIATGAFIVACAAMAAAAPAIVAELPRPW